MALLTLIIKWVHVSSACVLVGATVALLWAVLPDSGADGLPAVMVKRFRTLVHSSLGLLLLTGIYNFWSVTGGFQGKMAHSSRYQMIFGIKFLLFIAAFGIAIVAFRKSAAAVFPSGRRSLLAMLAAITVVIVGLSSYMNIYRFAQMK